MAAQFVPTPLLLLASKYDFWQAEAVLDVGAAKCLARQGPWGCKDDATRRRWLAHGTHVADAARRLGARGVSAFVTNCPSHCSNGHWASTVNGTRLDSAFTSWRDRALRRGGANASGRLWVACDTQTGCDSQPRGDSC